MGLCGSKMSAEDKASKELEKKNQADFVAEQSKIKLLLLGAGESGKSTIFKQFKILYGVGFTESELKAFSPVVYNNTIVAMKTLIQAAEDLEIESKQPEAARQLMDIEDDRVIDEEVGGWIKTLWKEDAGLQDAYARRAEFQMPDSAEYYFGKLDEIMAADYCATEKDILMSRVRTSGIVEEKYNIDGVEFVMYDVGGQRNERKKWIHCFDDVTAVIFVAAISEYDQVLYEDHRQNRVVEATLLFDEICNSVYFRETSMILFLNKSDLYEKKIKKVDIRNAEKGMFEEYDGGMCTCGGGYPTPDPCTCGVQDKGKEFLLNLFLEKNTSDEKDVYYHITCATDTANVSTVFNASKDIILKANLKGSGFME